MSVQQCLVSFENAAHCKEFHLYIFKTTFRQLHAFYYLKKKTLKVFKQHFYLNLTFFVNN